jgi:hypothetical protein
MNTGRCAYLMTARQPPGIIEGMDLYQSLLEPVAAGALGLAVVLAPTKNVPRLQPGRSVVVVVADDTPTGVDPALDPAGPDGFDQDVLRALLGAAAGAVVLAGPAEPEAYAAAAQVAASRRGLVVVVECTEEWGPAWCSRVKRLVHPDACGAVFTFADPVRH